MRLILACSCPPLFSSSDAMCEAKPWFRFGSSLRLFAWRRVGFERTGGKSQFFRIICVLIDGYLDVFE